MRTMVGAAFVIAGLVSLTGPATSAEMTAAEVKQFLSGKSVYLELAATSSGGEIGRAHV